MKIAVCGGGPAGCMAAARAAECGASVTLLEKNDKLLKKMFITGKGRCNITNDTNIDGFLANVVSNGKFLFGVLREFGCADTMAFFEGLRVPLKVERGNRVFPVSDKSSDLTRALSGYVQSLGVRILLSKPLSSLTRDEAGGKWLVNGEGYDCVILALGGVSYPVTGSTGDGYPFAKEFGHRVIPIRPALVGIDCKESFCRDVAGLTLKNVGFKCVKQGRIIFEDFGELLFTHTGISGPMVLSLSSRINRMEISELAFFLDMKPALSEKELDLRLLRDFAEFSNREFKNALGELLPSSLIPVMIARSGIGERKAVHQITSAERDKLRTLLKAFPLSPATLRPIAEAIVTAGGVDVKEINPKTMESKIAPGLYFAGEMMDVDALTGGFNLQIALSTGFAAGTHAAKESE